VQLVDALGPCSCPLHRIRARRGWLNKAPAQLLHSLWDVEPRLVLGFVAAGGLEGEDDDENPEQRVKRRLAQNREAARKSRQRRKQYVAKLEEEVRRVLRAIATLLRLGHDRSPAESMPRRQVRRCG